MTTLREAAQMALETLDNMVKVDWHEWDEFASVEDFVLWAKSRASFTAEALHAALAQPEQEPVGNTLTFMTRAIFNIVADHQEINGGYFIADGDVAAFVDRLAKIINSTFEPLKHKNTAPPQREWHGLTDKDIDDIARDDCFLFIDLCRIIEAKLKEKNSTSEKNIQTSDKNA